jgi:prepilin-type N-terminal cleavage/methylation domain-containing protein
MFTPESYRSPRKAFTIIELLVVLGIIVALAGITFGLLSGTTERGRISRAESELRALAQALEQYQGQYGDYPWSNLSGFNDNGEVLFNALAGTIGPQGDFITDDGGTQRLGRTFVEFSRLTVQFDEDVPSRLPDRDAPQRLENRFVDPWDNPYRYYYKDAGNPDNWGRRGFVLYSAGPSGDDEPPGNDGIVPDHRDNSDNIYFEN